MRDTHALLLKANLTRLQLPTMLAEWEKLAREAPDRGEPYHAYLPRLTELELATRAANAMAARVRAAGFPVLEEFDTFDFTATPGARQAEGARVGPWRLDRSADELLPDRGQRNREDAGGDRPGSGPVPAR